MRENTPGLDSTAAVPLFCLKFELIFQCIFISRFSLCVEHMLNTGVSLVLFDRKFLCFADCVTIQQFIQTFPVWGGTPESKCWVRSSPVLKYTLGIHPYHWQMILWRVSSSLWMSNSQTGAEGYFLFCWRVICSILPFCSCRIPPFCVCWDIMVWWNSQLIDKIDSRLCIQSPGSQNENKPVDLECFGFFHLFVEAGLFVVVDFCVFCFVFLVWNDVFGVCFVLFCFFLGGGVFVFGFFVWDFFFKEVNFFTHTWSPNSS